MKARIAALLAALALVGTVAVEVNSSSQDSSPVARCYFTWVSHPFLHWTYICVPDNGVRSW